MKQGYFKNQKERIKRGFMRKNDANLLKLVDSGVVDDLYLFFDMLEDGAITKPPTVPSGVNIDAKDAEGNTPAILAAIRGFIDIIKIVMDAGGNIHEPNYAGYTALHMASWHGKGDIVELLLKSNARCDVTSNNSETPLHFAANYGKSFVIVKLLNVGADINARNSKGETALDLACRFKHTEAAGLLIAGIEDRTNAAPLLDAIKGGNDELTELMLDAGYSPRFQDVSGRTPLHEAATFLRPRCCELLLEYGADMRVWDRESTTPLQIIEQYMSTMGSSNRMCKETYNAFNKYMLLDASFQPKKPTNLWQKEAPPTESASKVLVEQNHHPLLVSRTTWTLNNKEWRSSSSPGHSVTKAFDGNYQTEWVMPTGTNNFVIVDLGSPYKISGFRVVGWNTPAAPRTIQLQVADDFEGPYEIVRSFNAMQVGPSSNEEPGTHQDFFGFNLESQFIKIVIVNNHKFLSTSVQQFQFYGMDTLFEDWVHQTGLEPFKEKFTAKGYATYTDLCFLTTPEIEEIVPKELVVFTAECADFIRRDVMPVRRLWFEFEPHPWAVEGQPLKPFVVLGTPGCNDEIVLHCHGNPQIGGTSTKRLTANGRGPSYCVFDDITLQPAGHYMFEVQGVEVPEAFARQNKPVTCVMGIKSKDDVAAAFSVLESFEDI